MIKRIRPLEMGLEFEDGTYKLGDTINVTVDLIPKSVVDAMLKDNER